jgi:hypothetical protein
MYGKKVWKGLEVEGRFSDIMTVFVRELIDNKLPVNDLKEYPHYYFTIEYIASMIESRDSKHFLAIREILDTTHAVVTIEANKATLKGISTDLVNRCHIIYRIQDDALQLLKATDTVSIDAGWYRCHMIAKMHMQETTPDSYKFDEEL